VTDLRTRAISTIPAKACGCLIADVCDCLTPEASAAEWAALGDAFPALVVRTGPAPATPPGPSTSFPSSISLVGVGGLLRRVDGPAFAEEQK
jgi:hypothetical protein